MLKKAGLLTVGVTAGLLAVAPIASAGEASDHGHDKDRESSHDKDHGKKHHKKHSDGDRKHSDDFDASCDFSGGNAGAGSDVDGDSLANAIAQAPVAGNNIANIGNCSSFLNHNLNDNFSGNDIALSVLGNSGVDS